jgi:hypothetical protein
MLNPTLLRDFCSSFYGYGALDAAHWFISMEEGGGGSEQEIETRINVWLARGRTELDDIAEYHHDINQTKWFSPHPPIQRTWAAMIRVVLSFDSLATDVETVRVYQRDRLGRREGLMRLSPLLPLPSKSLNHWHYDAWTQDQAFVSRVKYRDMFADTRVKHLSQATRTLQPKTVTFLVLSYMEYWQQIASTKLVAHDELGYVGKANGTSFIACKHPAVKGVPNEYFVQVGHSHRAT